MDCSHLLDNVIISNATCAEDVAITKKFCCSECGVKEQVWLCLHCGVLNCGRYMNGHAKLHFESSHHQLCMSCDVFSVYCYKCDDYVSNDLENGAIDKIRKQIMYLCNTPDLNEEYNNGNSIDDSENDNFSIYNNSENCDGVISSTKNNRDELHIINETSNSSSSDISFKTNKTLDNIENSKNAWPVEVRNLRPRPKKRSHSESSSTENNAQQSKANKLEKLTACNGKSQRDKRVVGLKNLGNTCFMNAVLQSLSNIQEFSCYFNQLPCLESKPNGRRVYHSRSYTRQDVSEVVMAEELRKVLINLNSGCGSKGAISPECLFLVIWKVVPRFRGYQQQDAHEFLRYMLDRLHTELLQLVPHDRSEVGFVSKAPSASIVTAVFGGTLQSEVKCLACGTQSNKYDPFLDLSLELPETGRHDAPVTLNDCLASFVQVEELADTERYFCSSCKCKQKSTKQFWIRRLPNVLCLHLKRFRWHNYFRTKVDTTVEFPLQALDMGAYVLRGGVDTRRAGLGSLYDLACVVVHHGSGAGSGHYTAFAINDGQWFHFNDQTVRASNEKSVAACKPYILFYIRREIS